MMCKDCSFWNGTKYSEWGDCYRVIFKLEPRLKNCKSTIDGVSNYYMWEPFDPNDLQYFSKNNEIKNLLRNLKKKLPDGVRVQRINKNDFFQTRRDFICKCYN